MHLFSEYPPLSSTTEFASAILLITVIASSPSLAKVLGAANSKRGAGEILLDGRRDAIFLAASTASSKVSQRTSTVPAS